MMRGIFLCTCGRQNKLNFKKLKNRLSNQGKTEIYDYFCSPKGMEYIAHLAERWGLSSIYMAACSDKAESFEKLGEEIDVPIYTINIRETCGWVHDREEATEKAALLVKSAIASVEVQHDAAPVVVGGREDVILAGDFEKAREFANLLPEDVKVRMIARSASPEGVVQEFLAGEIKSISGEFGDFKVGYEVAPIDSRTCIGCGKCEASCPEGAISLLTYSISDSCTRCGKCIKVCPVGAISFENREAIAEAGQVVIFGNWMGPNRHGIFQVKGEGDYAEVLSKLIPGFYKRAKPRYIEARLEHCASGKSTIVGCQFCEASCPEGAVIREGERIRFSEVSCVGCGACVAACPLSVPELVTLPQAAIDSQLTQLLSSDKMRKKVIAFTCENQWEKLLAMGKKGLSYPPVLPLLVPCIGALSIPNLLLPFAMGADGVILLGCGECRHSSSTPAVGFVTKLLEGYGMQNALLEIRGRTPEETAEAIKSFYGNLSPSPFASAGKIDGNQVQRVLKILKAFSSFDLPEIRILDERLPFGYAEIAREKCTFCNACISMCPTSALTKADSKLEFSHSKCINCRLCERACPEGAIRVESVFDLREYVGGEKKMLVEEEMLPCEGCGRRVIPRGMLRKSAEKLVDAGIPGDSLQIRLLEYCERCRGKKVLELLMEGRI
jgi:ferredoxin